MSLLLRTAFETVAFASLTPAALNPFEAGTGVKLRGSEDFSHLLFFS